jgi:O-antigen/teichoic acid export membrane protein
MSPNPAKRSLTESTLHGLLWQYISVIAQALLSLIVLSMLARLLSADDFGLLAIALIIVGFAALFSQLGVGPALIQRSELTPGHIRVGFTFSILFSVALTIVIFMLAPLAAAFFRNDSVADVLRAVSLSFLFAGAGIVAESLLKRNLEFKKLMFANVGSYLLGYAVIGIALAWLGYGVWALVAATLGQSLLHTAFMYLLSRHPVAPSLARSELRELLFFGGGFTLARFLNYSATQGDNIVVGRAMGPEPLGLYSRAYGLMMLPAKYFAEVLAVVLFPVMARLQNDLKKLTGAYLSGVALVSIIGAPIGLLMVILAPEIVNVVLGPRWSDAILPFQILALGVLPRVSYKMDDAVARALGAMYRRSGRDAIYAFAVFLGATIGLNWGLPGVAAGVLVAVVLNYVLAIRMSLSLLDCSWSKFASALVPCILPTIVVAVASLGTREALHALGSPDWFTLLVALGASAAGMIGLFLLQPQLLGVYGTDILNRSVPLLPMHLLPKATSRWLQERLRQA